MFSFLNTVFYILTFVSVYIQVFFLVTFLDKKNKIVIRKGILKLETYPAVTIIIPCYNESKTIKMTVDSLLHLDYPKDKLKLIIVDDGSKDDTWQIIKEFEKPIGFQNSQLGEYPEIKVFHKENGGKYTALNLGLKYVQTPFLGCLDADSFVDSEALKRIMTYFDEVKTMAVAPSVIVDNPKNILQGVQKAEYDMAIYTKKMLAFLGGIHVTPGPFSIFRKKVFDDLGPYRHAYNTEDQEIALRMQEHHYKIEHCPDAYVYTVAPSSVRGLYRQRQRWIYGFIRNVIDYRRLLFRKEYGTIAFFTLPSGIISVVSVIFLFGILFSNLITFIFKKISEIKIIGLNGTLSNQILNFDPFFFNTKAIVFVSIILYTSIIMALLIGRSILEGKPRFSFDMFYFIIIYSVIAPFWLLKAIFNALRSKEPNWILEREVKIAKKQNATAI